MSTQCLEDEPDAARGASKSKASQWLNASRDPGWGLDPRRFDPARVERVVTWASRWFAEGGSYPVQIEGLDRFPTSPAMIVSNHSGGSTVLDCLGLAYGWYRHFGLTRPLHFLAHEILLSTRLTGPFFDQVGVLRTSRGIAREVLGEWQRDVVVMPGGDRDTWRPWRDRYSVRFCGRMGYARLALQTGVPVVPIAHTGSHNTLVILTDGQRIAQRLGLKSLFRIHVFPIHLSLPWLVGVGPWPHLPWPTPLRYRVGAPVPLPNGGEPDPSPSPERVTAYDAEVRAALQTQLDALARVDLEAERRPVRRHLAARALRRRNGRASQTL